MSYSRNLINLSVDNYLLSLVFFGFYLFLVISEMLIPDYSGYVSYGYRIVCLLALSYFSIKMKTIIRFSDFLKVMPLFLFFLLFFIAICNSIIFMYDRLESHPFYFIVFFFFVVFLPSIVIVFIDFYKFDDKDLLKSFLFIIAFALFLIVSFFLVTPAGERGFGGRLSTSFVNPISVGHLAVSGIIILYFFRGFNVFFKIFLLSCFFACLFFSQSRGPLVSLFGVIFCVFLVNSGVSKKIKMIMLLLFICIPVFLFLFLFRVELDGFSLLDTYKNFATGRDLSASIRLESYEKSIYQFSDSPFFGGSIFEKDSMYYPHNLVLEALISTGLLGTFILLFQLGMVFFYAIRVFNRSLIGAVFVCLFYQYLAGSLFSGSIITNNLMWYFLLSVISLSLRRKNKILHDF